MLCQLQRVLRVNANQSGLAMIEIVRTFTEVKIQDIDTVHLLYLLIDRALAHVLCYGLGHSVEHALKVVELTALLDLYNDDTSLGVLCLDVDPVELVILMLLVGFALEKLDDLDLLTNKNGDKPLEDRKVRFRTKHVLRCPVESDVPVTLVSHTFTFHFSFTLILHSY